LIELTVDEDVPDGTKIEITFDSEITDNSGQGLTASTIELELENKQVEDTPDEFYAAVKWIAVTAVIVGVSTVVYAGLARKDWLALVNIWTFLGML
jgi:hypothetical protein